MWFQLVIVFVVVFLFSVIYSRRSRGRR